MRRTFAAIMAVTALACAARAEEDGPRPFDRLDAACWQPLSDAQSGRLYDAASVLLSAARSLPTKIDLGVRPAAEPPPPEPPDAEDVSEAPERIAPAEPGKQRWLTACERPVVSEEDLAHAHFRAGSFEQAAALYRQLRQERTEDPHLLLMLLLCERNAGNAEGAEELLAEVEEAGEGAAEWAEWLRAMSALNEQEDEESG
jgi:hypothetical protein